MRNVPGGSETCPRSLSKRDDGSRTRKSHEIVSVAARRLLGLLCYGFGKAQWAHVFLVLVEPEVHAQTFGCRPGESARAVAAAVGPHYDGLLPQHDVEAEEGGLWRAARFPWEINLIRNVMIIPRGFIFLLLISCCSFVRLTEDQLAVAGSKGRHYMCITSCHLSHVKHDVPTILCC